mgnify:FL=1
MRTLGLSVGAAALIASLAAPSLASAQRNSRRSMHRAIAPSATSSAVSPCRIDCGDYSLSVVSALLPVEDSGSTSPQVVTLVIENRGTATAPVSLVSVARQNQLAAAHHSTIPALAPGERATVQLPVETGPDGTQCISITIMPAPERDPATRQRLASAPAEGGSLQGLLPRVTDLTALPRLPYWTALPAIAVVPDDGRYATVDDISPFDVPNALEAFGSLRS